MTCIAINRAIEFLEYVRGARHKTDSTDSLVKYMDRDDKNADERRHCGLQMSQYLTHTRLTCAQ